MKLSDFTFHLPPELIARYPVEKRSASRLMCVGSEIVHKHFYDVLDLLNPGDLLIFNNTKVIPARLFGKKASGGRVELLVERILDNECILAQVRVSKPPRVGDSLFFDKDVVLSVEEKQEKFYLLRQVKPQANVLETIEAIGQIPLPPYMQRTPDASDLERYQTVYAKEKGSAAAPTAGLHFDEDLLEKLRAKNINMGFLTLHIGAGTFAPVRVENLADHKMHSEYFEISQALCEKITETKKNKKRVVAVGTTSLRALEAASVSGETLPYQGDTNIFITPGYQFNCVDALITNLHLPNSTLLMLVCAFAGYERMMQAYHVAVSEKYRFYSYGDAMWLAG